MTEHRSFKRLVRARMVKTAESYTAARAMLLRAEGSAEANTPRLATSDEKIRERTGHGWEDWFAMLDESGGEEKQHREIARWVAEQLEIEPLAWNAQAIASSYELTRGLRAIGEKPEGFAMTASKTIAVPVERLYEAFVEESVRERWLPDGPLLERTATPPKSARFDWGDGKTRIHVTFLPKAEARGTIALEHSRLPDAEERERMKAFWRERLGSLQSLLEGPEIDA